MQVLGALSCRRCTSALAADARLAERELPASGTLDPGSEERLLGRGALPSEWTAWRLCASLLGDVMGPEGPVTSLPTLDRVREGLKRQGLRRVVTGRPVTTLAGDADVRGVVRRAVSSAGSRAHHTSWLSRSGSRMGTTTGAGLGGSASRLSGCRSSRRPSGAVGTAWRPLLRRDRGPPGTVRSPMTGRASSSDDAARTQGVTSPTSLRSRTCRGVHLQCAYRAPRLGISTQEPARGLARITARWALIPCTPKTAEANTGCWRTNPRRAAPEIDLSGVMTAQETFRDRRPELVRSGASGGASAACARRRPPPARFQPSHGVRRCGEPGGAARGERAAAALEGRQRARRAVRRSGDRRPGVRSRTRRGASPHRDGAV